MRVVASIKMYSGIRDPELEITEETSKKICEMLCQAYEKSPKELLPKLGPQGYMVVWEAENSPTVWLHVHEGIIALSCFAATSYLKDTVGLELYLQELLAETLRNHYAEAGKAMSQLYDELRVVAEKAAEHEEDKYDEKVLRATD